MKYPHSILEVGENKRPNLQGDYLSWQVAH